MQLSLKILLVVILLIYLFIISKSVKNKNMRINYLIFWTIIGIILIIALFAPNFVEKLSIIFGFELPINMIFSGAIFVILYLIFDLTRLITQEQNKNVMVIQEISILKNKIKKLENEKEEKNE